MRDHKDSAEQLGESEESLVHRLKRKLTSTIAGKPRLELWRVGRTNLTIHNDLNVLEVDLSPSQDPALTAISALICFLDAFDLQVVVGQDYKSD